MKTRILAFVALLAIALAWHSFLIRHNSVTTVAPSVEASEKREPAQLKEALQSSAQAAKPGAALSPSLEKTKSAMERLKNCLESERCEFPKTDPRSYGLAVGQAAAEELLTLIAEVQAQELQTDAIRDLALDAFQWEDDHVRARALELMATQKPAPGAVLALMNGLRASHDAQIYKQSLPELSKFTGDQERGAVEDFLAETIQFGPQGAATAVAGNLIPFLNGDNVDRFQQLLARLSPATQRFEALKQSLEDFERR